MKFRPPYLGKATAVTRAALPSPTSVWRIFSCFCNQLNCDMDYWIFKVRTWSILCVRIHMGVGHTDESDQQYWLGKQIFLVLLTGFEPWVFGSQVRRSTNWATPPRKSNRHNFISIANQRSIYYVTAMHTCTYRLGIEGSHIFHASAMCFVGLSEALFPHVKVDQRLLTQFLVLQIGTVPCVKTLVLITGLIGGALLLKIIFTN